MSPKGLRNPVAVPGTLAFRTLVAPQMKIEPRGLQPKGEKQRQTEQANGLGSMGEKGAVLPVPPFPLSASTALDEAVTGLRG